MCDVHCDTEDLETPSRAAIQPSESPRRLNRIAMVFRSSDVGWCILSDYCTRRTLTRRSPCANPPHPEDMTDAETPAGIEPASCRFAGDCLAIGLQRQTERP